MEAFTIEGYWWLPRNADKKVEGEFTFDPGGDTRLELSDVLEFVEVIDLGTFTDTEPIILGEDDEGQSITLVNCSEEPPSIASPESSSIGVLAYRPRYIVRGCHYESKGQFVLNQLTVDFYGLQVWADPRRRAGFISPVFNSAEDSSVDEIMVPAGDFRVRIRRYFPQEHLPEDETVCQFAFVDFLTDDPFEFEGFLEQIFRFQIFLGLAMHTSTWPVLVQAPHPEDASRQITIHYAPVTDYQKVDGLNSTFMYFTLEDALPYLEQGLKQWFEKTEKLYRVLQMYNRVISMRMFLEEEFMIYARAVEVYHRQMHTITYVDEEKFDEIREVIESSTPEGTDRRLRQAILNSIKHANNPSLRGRLKDIRNRHQHYSDRLFERYNSFVNDVVNTRNYLTHFDERDKHKAMLEFKDLYRMRERLRVILELCLLSELGLSNKEIQHIIWKRAVSLPM